MGATSSIRYEEARNEGLSSSIWYEESRKQDFVRPIRSRVNGGLVLIRLVRRNQACEISSVLYEVTQKECLTLFVQYEESSRLDFVSLVRRHAKGELVLVLSVRGIKLAGLRLSDTKWCERKACLLPSGVRNQLRLPSMKSHNRRACPRLSGTRKHEGWTSPSGTKSCNWRACLCLFGTRNQAGFRPFGTKSCER